MNGFWFRSQEDLDVMCFNVWSGNEMRLLFEYSHHPCFLFLMDRKMIMNQEEDKEEDEVGKK